jgi:hypothetical protein
MAFDPLTGWITGHAVNSGDKPSDGVVSASGTFSTKNAQDLQKLLQEIVDALDFIADN